MEQKRRKLENWQEEYRRKLVSTEEAAQVIKSGDNIFIPSVYLGNVAQAIAARHEELRDVHIEVQAPLFDPGWLSPGMEESFKVIVRIFLGPTSRLAHDEGHVSFLPYTNGTWFKLYRDNRQAERDIDVALFNVSPPDENGFLSFGEAVWERRKYADHAKTIIAEMDENLIRSRGDTFLHVSEVDYLVDSTAPPLVEEEIELLVNCVSLEKQDQARKTITLANPRSLRHFVEAIDDIEQNRIEVLLGLDEPDDASRGIVEHLKTILRDRDTIQMGIGSPSKFMIELGLYDNLNDLSIFSEMACPGMGFLVKRGIATGKYATVHPGKAVFAALSGMRREEILWADDNPLIEQYSSDYVVNIANVARNQNMVSINNAIQMDLTGQITCESQFGPRLINGPGGQIEFHIGAFFAPGGRAVTLLRSTWADGAVSNIVPYLDQGSLVSIPRVYADMVVTEYGVAELLGKTHRERTRELIRVAHPDFRAELEKAAQDIF
ncbi:MAG: hypothetical protein JRI95_16460 [Deltaproteobacteria bacterium]|nr:hypothetical protein [Deltaproteobacteria bacterium]